MLSKCCFIHFIKISLNELREMLKKINTCCYFQGFFENLLQLTKESVHWTIHNEIQCTWIHYVLLKFI